MHGLARVDGLKPMYTFRSSHIFHNPWLAGSASLIGDTFSLIVSLKHYSAGKIVSVLMYAVFKKI